MNGALLAISGVRSARVLGLAQARARNIAISGLISRIWAARNVARCAGAKWLGAIRPNCLLKVSQRWSAFHAMLRPNTAMAIAAASHGPGVSSRRRVDGRQASQRT